jgi:hypothetical protein
VRHQALSLLTNIIPNVLFCCAAGTTNVVRVRDGDNNMRGAHKINDTPPCQQSAASPDALTRLRLEERCADGPASSSGADAAMEWDQAAGAAQRQ